MCTLEKRGNVYILTLTGPGEHRLNPTLFSSLIDSLHCIRTDPNPSALVTTATGKFFSNGYDVSWAKSSGPEQLVRVRLMSAKLRELVKELVGMNMPTIAAVTGHASAAGFVLALSHDYVVMRKERGFLYMSELDISLPVPAWFVAVLRSKKWGSSAALRDVALAAKKLNAGMAVEMGIIDAAYEGADATIEAAVKLGEELVKKKWDGHVYAHIRKVLRADVLRAVEFDETVDDPAIATKYGSRL